MSFGGMDVVLVYINLMQKLLVQCNNMKFIALARFPRNMYHTRNDTFFSVHTWAFIFISQLNMFFVVCYSHFYQHLCCEFIIILNIFFYDNPWVKFFHFLFYHYLLYLMNSFIFLGKFEWFFFYWSSLNEWNVGIRRCIFCFYDLLFYFLIWLIDGFAYYL